MKAIKIYISVYPLWYRILVFIGIPVLVIVLGTLMFARVGNVSAFDWGMITSLSSMGLIYAELFGEWFTIGEICVRKGAFGEAVLSSPKGREFVKSFAIVDVLRKAIGYPIIFAVAQLAVMIINPAASKVLDGAAIGFVFAVAIIVGVWVIRVTKAMGLRFLSLFATGSIVTVLAFPFLLVQNSELKIVIGIVAFVLTVLFAFLSARSVIRSSKEDYFDEKTN